MSWTAAQDLLTTRAGGQDDGSYTKLFQIKDNIASIEKKNLMLLGSRDGLLSLLRDLQRQYECTGQVLGTNKGDVQRLKILGWIRSLTSEGIEWEGDPKHVAAYLDK